MVVKTAEEDDLSTIYMMGFDVWGEGFSAADYLKACEESAKYSKGTWYVLEQNAKLVSSLIVYEGLFKLPQRCAGIGSVATNQAHRKRGYAARLMTEVIQILSKENKAAIYLFSDIAPEYYQQFGFELISAEQPYDGTHCMILAFNSADKLRAHAPEYF